jgi:hypothetical protein
MNLVHVISEFKTDEDCRPALRYFYPENAPRIHKLPYWIREMFLLTVTIAAMDRGTRI